MCGGKHDNSCYKVDEPRTSCLLVLTAEFDEIPATDLKRSKGLAFQRYQRYVTKFDDKKIIFSMNWDSLQS